MKQKTPKSKKHTIFRIFLAPLIVIMLMQSLLAVGTLSARHVIGTIQNYSVGLMARTVENRRVILENALVRHRAAVCEQELVMREIMRQYLQEQGISLEQMLSDGDRRQEALELFLPKCMDNLQSNQSTGVFLVLTGQDVKSAAEYDGFYVRDSNPMTSTVNNTDLLFERGRKELSRTFGVPLDTNWTTAFHMAGDGQREEDKFFYEPWRVGSLYPDAGVENLGYWSAPFSLETSGYNPYRMITYSIPLRYEGEVYGILGMEIACNFLNDYLPVAELNEREQSGYLLAWEMDETYRVLLGKGSLCNSVPAETEDMKLRDTKYRALYQVKDARFGVQNIYAAVCPLKLYGDFAPYEDVNWVLIGLDTEEDLFAMGRQIYMGVGIAILLGLFFGVIGIYFIVLHLTKPIQNLVRCINGGSAGLKEFQASNILEIDGLYEVIRDLTVRQKESKNILMEEKERYRVALEGTSDTFFTYNFENNCLDIINHPTMNGSWQCGTEGFFDMDHVYYEDRALLDKLIRESSAEENISIEFRFRFPDQEDFTWYALYGKVVNDAEGNRYKMVGGLRDIQKQKEQEAQQKTQMELDSVTGFYAYDTGLERLEQCRGKQPKGCAVYLRLDGLREMNEENGVVFADMILEELGRAVRKCFQRMNAKNPAQAIAIRMDGDEFVLWLESRQRKQAESFVKDLFEAVEALFDKEVLQLRVYAGLTVATGAGSSTELVRMAKFAQMRVGKDAPERYSFYEDIPGRKKKALPELQGSRPISNDYGEEINLASLALSLFGKGANLPAQMVLILRKMGYHYGATDVLTTILRPDFHSNYLEYQWHRNPKEQTEIVNRYSDGEWDEFQEWLGFAQVRSFTVKESSWPVLQKFLNIEEGQNGIVLPMYDNGNYMGNIAVLGVESALLRNMEEQHKLAEVGSVIQSQLNQQQHDLASKAKSDFLSRMSHEIRTPMNGIIGMTTIALQKDQSKERMLDCLNKIQDSSKYLLGLINDILDMSKIESGKMHLEFVNFDLQEMVDTVCELVRPQMEAKQIEFVQELEIENKWFFADKMRISQVLINLLGNAAKFTRENGRVVLSIKEKPTEGGLPRIRFAVQDNGVGISKEDQKRVFRAFEQTREASSISRQQGTGLGLSISSRLIQMMGSMIDLESEVGKGSCFSFEIALEPGQTQQQEADRKEEISFENFKVLVVEDNELNVEVAKCILEEYGFTVDCVYNGEQAVERIRETAPGTYDVVLMDIMMPVMNGLEATRAIRRLEREDCRTLPIIAMSANAFDDDLKKSVECGMNGHLSKPVEVDKLYALLKKILNQAG